MTVYKLTDACDLTRGASLEGAHLNWNSHWLLGTLLLQAAGSDIEKRKIAGLVAVSTDWCWKHFLSMDDLLRGWALGVLSQYVVDGDVAPSVLQQAERPKGTSV